MQSIKCVMKEKREQKLRRSSKQINLPFPVFLSLGNPAGGGVGTRAQRKGWGLLSLPAEKK